MQHHPLSTVCLQSLILAPVSLRLSTQKSALIGQLIDQNCWSEVAASPLFYMYPTTTVSRLNANVLHDDIIQ